MSGQDGEPIAPRAPRGNASSTSQVRGSTLLLGGRLIGLALGLVIQLLLVRLLAKDDYGAFAWCLSIVTVAQALVPLGLDRIDTRYLAMFDERGDDRRVVGVVVTEALTIAAVGVLLFVIVLFWHSRFSPGIAPSQTAADLLVLMILLAPLGAIDALVMQVFATFAGARAVFFRRYLLEPGLRLAAIVTVFLVGGGVYGLTVGYVLASLVGVALYTAAGVALLRRIGVLGALDGRVDLPLRELFRDGVPMLTSTLVWVAAMAAPTIVLGAVGTAEEVAALRAVGPIAALTTVAAMAFVVLFPPLLARQWERGDTGAVRLTYWRTALWVTVGGYPALLLGTAFATTTTVTLLGERYAGSAPLLAVSAAGLWLSGAVGFNPVMLTTAGRLRALFWGNVAALVVCVALAAVLIPAYGAWGAAVTGAASMLAASLIRQVPLRGLPTGVVERRLAVPAAALALGLALAYAVEVLLDPGFVVALVVSAVLSAGALLVSLPYLDVASTFPELLRLPVLGPVLTRVVAAPRRPSRNPYLAASGTGTPEG